MYKRIAVLGLLLASLTAVNSQSAPSSLTSPYIVAKGKFVGQTMPTTTFFTPARTGLYRISMYITIVTADPSATSCFYPEIRWTDDAGSEIANGFLFACGYGTQDAWSAT